MLSILSMVNDFLLRPLPFARQIQCFVTELFKLFKCQSKYFSPSCRIVPESLKRRFHWVTLSPLLFIMGTTYRPSLSSLVPAITYPAFFFHSYFGEGLGNDIRYRSLDNLLTVETDTPNFDAVTAVVWLLRYERMALRSL